jgi:hypothetical protein
MGYWFVNTAGIGSLVVLTVGLSVFAIYLYVLRWIQTAPPDPAPVSTGADQPDEAAVAGSTTGGEAA